MESVGPGHTQLASNPTSIPESGLSQLRSRQPYTDFISSHTPQSVRSEALSPTTGGQSKLAENAIDRAVPHDVNDKCSSSSSSSNNAGKILNGAGALEASYKAASLRQVVHSAAKQMQDKEDMKRMPHEKPVNMLQPKYAGVGIDNLNPSQGRSQGNQTQQRQQNSRQQQHHQQPSHYQQQQNFLKGLTPPTRAGRSQAIQLRSVNGVSLLGYPPAKAHAAFLQGSQQPQTKSFSRCTSQAVQQSGGMVLQPHQTGDNRGKRPHAPGTEGFKTAGVQSRPQGNGFVSHKHNVEPAPGLTGIFLPGSRTAAAGGELTAVGGTLAAGDKFFRHVLANADTKHAAVFEPNVLGRLCDPRSALTARACSTPECTSLDYLTGAAAAAGVVPGEMLQPCTAFPFRGPSTERQGGYAPNRVTRAEEDQQTKNREVSSRRSSAEKENTVPHPGPDFNFRMNFQQFYASGEPAAFSRSLHPLQNSEEGAGILTNITLPSFVPQVEHGFASGVLNVLAEDVYYWSEPIGHSKDDPSVQVYAGVIMDPEKQREAVAVKRIPLAAASKVRDTFALLERFTQLDDPLVVNTKRVYCLRTNDSTSFKENEDRLSLMLVLEKCEGRLSEMISLNELGERCLQEPLPPPGMTEMLSHLISGVLKIQQHSRAAHMRIHPGNVLLTDDFELKIGDCAGKLRYLSVVELLETGLQGAQQARDLIQSILNSPAEASWLSPELLRSFMYMAQQITLLLDQQKVFPSHGKDNLSFAVLAQNLKWDTPFLQNADAWSTGATLFYIVSGGRHPYGDPDERSTIKNILEDRKVNIGKIRGSPLIYDLVESLLESDPAKRLSLCQALCHPTFWKMGETEHFLREFRATVEAHPDSYLVLALSDPFPWISSLACGASPLFSLLISYLASPSCPQLLLTSLRVENGLSFLLFLSLLSSDSRLPGKDRRALVSSAILLHPAAFLKAVRLLLFPRVPRDPAELIISRSSTYVKHYLGHFSCNDLLHASTEQAGGSVTKRFGRAVLRNGALISSNGASSTSSSGFNSIGSKTGGSNTSGNGGSLDVAASPPSLQLADTSKGGAPRSVLFDQCRALCPSYSGAHLQRQSQNFPPPPPPMPSRYDTTYNVRMPPAGAAPAVGTCPNQPGAPSFAGPHAVFASPSVAGTAAAASSVVSGSLGLPCVPRPPPPPPPALIATEVGVDSQQPGNLEFPFSERILLANAGADASLLLRTRAQFYADATTVHEGAPHAHSGFLHPETDALCSASTRMIYTPTGTLEIDQSVRQPDEPLLFLYHDKDDVCAPAGADAGETTARAPSTAEDARTAPRDTCMIAMEGSAAAGERLLKKSLDNVEARIKYGGHSHGLSLSPLSSSMFSENADPGTAVPAAAKQGGTEGVLPHVSPQRIAQRGFFPAETETSKSFAMYSFDDKYVDPCAYPPSLHSPKGYALHATAVPMNHTTQRKQYGDDAMKSDPCDNSYPGMTCVDDTVCLTNDRNSSNTETANDVGHKEYAEEYEGDVSKESNNQTVYRKGYTDEACKERGVDGSAPRAGSTSASSQSTRLYTSSTPPIFPSDKAEEQFQFLKYQASSSQVARPQAKGESGTVSLAASNCTLSPSHDSCLSEAASTTNQLALSSEAAQPDTAGTPLKEALETEVASEDGESEHTGAHDKPNQKGDAADERNTVGKRAEKEREDAVDFGLCKGRKNKPTDSLKKVITCEKQKKDIPQRAGAGRTKTSC